MDQPGYVLMTAARDEAPHVDRLFACVARQTLPPLRWVFVDDGSADATAHRATAWRARLPYLEVVRRARASERSFGSKVFALRDAYARCSSMAFGCVGVLDADVSFEPEYFRRLMERFAHHPRLGIGGGFIRHEAHGRTWSSRAGLYSVGGQVQMFRRACWEQIGGYLPLEAGGEDAAAEVMARACGWTVRSFPELPVLHHRATGTAGRSIWAAWFRFGVQDYRLGYHPVYFFARCLYRACERPWLLGAVCQAAGFVACAARRAPRPVDAGFVRTIRAEQMARLFGRGRMPAENAS